ncbi:MULTISPECIES: IclR family transcriptional regulator [Achromobacter]|uniref:IclR family transcriptional regulator n=1 Tax=Achromobacter TaxID=222 RepID=UPI001C44FC5D|nr:IclR family transcriptional regulator [Achromobacter sp. ACM05]MBV7499823.1 IclR family transcriptional regulator [Achromobacter sp. ACM05]
MVKLLEDSTESSRTGAQSLSRALGLLKLVSTFNLTGARLSDIVSLSGLAKPTVHRLLSELLASGLLMRDDQKLYRLGNFAHELGVIASSQFKIRDVCQCLLAELAGETGATAYLKVRSGQDVFCLDIASRNDKAWSSRGSRVALGVGACGMAILSFLPEQERLIAMQGSTSQPGMSAPLHLEKLLFDVEQTRHNGYSFSEGDVVPGVTAAAIPIFDPVGTPVVAVSLAMPSVSWTDGTRKKAIGSLLSTAAKMRRDLVNAQALVQPRLQQ